MAIEANDDEILIRNVSVITRKGRAMLNRINIKLTTKQNYCILGLENAGLSEIVKLLEFTIPYTWKIKGEMVYNSEDMTRMTSFALVGVIRYIPQMDAELTVYELLQYYLSFYGEENRKYFMGRIEADAKREEETRSLKAKEQNVYKYEKYRESQKRVNYTCTDLVKLETNTTVMVSYTRRLVQLLGMEEILSTKYRFLKLFDRIRVQLMIAMVLRQTFIVIDAVLDELEEHEFLRLLRIMHSLQGEFGVSFIFTSSMFLESRLDMLEDKNVRLVLLCKGSIVYEGRYEDSKTYFKELSRWFKMENEFECNQGNKSNRFIDQSTKDVATRFGGRAKRINDKISYSGEYPENRPEYKHGLLKHANKEAEFLRDQLDVDFTNQYTVLDSIKRYAFYIQKWSKKSEDLAINNYSGISLPKKTEENTSMRFILLILDLKTRLKPNIVAVHYIVKMILFVLAMLIFTLLDKIPNYKNENGMLFIRDYSKFKNAYSKETGNLSKDEIKDLDKITAPSIDWLSFVLLSLCFCNSSTSILLQYDRILQQAYRSQIIPFISSAGFNGIFKLFQITLFSLPFTSILVYMLDMDYLKTINLLVSLWIVGLLATSMDLMFDCLYLFTNSNIVRVIFNTKTVLLAYLIQYLVNGIKIVKITSAPFMLIRKVLIYRRSKSVFLYGAVCIIATIVSVLFARFCYRLTHTLYANPKHRRFKLKFEI
ncbi:hypothetical protein ECANGB1_1534 [Enterospora canceri]|uniref:ABC transporter domain-containing protein n=1 Tax=Enterospora canceri TaxID=1081671 RepID=A0A1Y1S5V4_9MICR|nr:hypothetical protein ECANGB1_1534 [Enterospora canceri]